MNAGKSTALLQSSYNYAERGMRTMVLTPKLDDRFGTGKVTSRIGISADAVMFENQTDLFDLVRERDSADNVDCVLVDESQFMSRQQVQQLGRVCDDLNLPVLAYGLRTDFRGEPFEGSQYLLAWADNLKEIKTVCHCGKKATMVVRLDSEGNVIREGAQVEIGGNERYVSLCRKHFTRGVASPSSDNG